MPSAKSDTTDRLLSFHKILVKEEWNDPNMQHTVFVFPRILIIPRDDDLAERITRFPERQGLLIALRVRFPSAGCLPSGTKSSTGNLTQRRGETESAENCYLRPLCSLRLIKQETRCSTAVLRLNNPVTPERQGHVRAPGLPGPDETRPYQLLVKPPTMTPPVAQLP